MLNLAQGYSLTSAVLMLDHHSLARTQAIFGLVDEAEGNQAAHTG